MEQQKNKNKFICPYWSNQLMCSVFIVWSLMPVAVTEDKNLVALPPAYVTLVFDSKLVRQKL